MDVVRTRLRQKCGGAETCLALRHVSVTNQDAWLTKRERQGNHL
jgi:hypothetical protein